MPQLFLNIFSDQLIPAITWTLIHSVWEGLIFAFSAGIIIVTTNKSKAAKRYNLLALNLITFLLVVTITCCYEVNIKPDITISYVQPLKENVHINLQLTNSEQIEKISNYLTAYIDSNAYIIVFVWSSAMLFKCLLLLIGLQKLHMLKTEKIHIVNEFWNKKFRELSGKLQLRKHVQLLQSGIAKVPMVIGHLKPVVLIPFGLLTALTQEEAEAILLHELAHIKRNDYLINLLQTFIQTIFFFNPAVLWMSSMLRNERENCCDDIAVTYLRNKTNYVNALVAFQEYNLKIEGLTTAFPGKRYH